jgi:uncharacterized protein
MAVRNFALRLRPGADLKAEIAQFVRDHNISAGWIITCVGSLSSYSLRFANQQKADVENAYFEILSLVGTLGTGGCHLHLSVSDEAGATVGGHLLDGCIIYTTAELVLASEEAFIFEREKDKQTGYKELVIYPSEKTDDED